MSLVTRGEREGERGLFLVQKAPWEYGFGSPSDHYANFLSRHRQSQEYMILNKDVTACNITL